MFLFLAMLKISRPLNCIITFITIEVACFICGDIDQVFWKALFGGIVGAMVAASGNIINDYFDFESDEINHPNRVLPAGILDPRTALHTYYVLIAVSILLTLFLSVYAFLVVFFTIVLLYFYSLKLKSIPLVGNITVAILTGLAFIFGSIVVGNPLCGIFPALFAFLINILRELIKDIEDIKGDQISGFITFPVKYGIYKTINMITIIGLLFILTTAIPFLVNIYNIIYFILVITFVNSIIVFIILKLRRSVSAYDLSLTSMLLKTSMVVGIIAILLGSKI